MSEINCAILVKAILERCQSSIFPGFSPRANFLWKSRVQSWTVWSHEFVFGISKLIWTFPEITKRQSPPRWVIYADSRCLSEANHGTLSLVSTHLTNCFTAANRCYDEAESPAVADTGGDAPLVSRLLWFNTNLAGLVIVTLSLCD